MSEALSSADVGTGSGDLRVDGGLRVAMVGRYFNRQGGVSRWLAECADRGALEFRSTVFTQNVEDLGECRAALVRVPMIYRPKWLQLPTFGRSVGQALVRESFDLVHVHNPQFSAGDLYTAHSCNTAHIQARRRDANTVERTASLGWPPHVSGNWSERRAYRPDGRRVLPLVAAVSHQVARELHDVLGVPADNLTVTHPGVDVSQFRPLSAEERGIPTATGAGGATPIHLVFVGYEFERKGLMTAIRAMAQLGPGVVALTVLGKDDPARYRAEAVRLGVGDDVSFVGHVERPEKLIASADALLLPSVYEAFPLVVMEALACGTPVLASNESNAGEIVHDGITGMLYGPARSIESLAQAISRFGSARVGWPEMRGAARRRAEARTWDHAWQDTKDAYAETLQRLRVVGPRRGRT